MKIFFNIIICLIIFSVRQIYGFYTIGGFSAIETGVGGASVANPAASSVYYNPALLSVVGESSISGTYSDLYGLNFFNYYSLSFVSKKGFGLGVTYLAASSDVSYLNYSESFQYFSFGYPLVKSFYIGGTLKSFISRSAENYGGGWGINAGLIFYSEDLPIIIGFRCSDLLDTKILWKSGNEYNIKRDISIGVRIHLNNIKFLVSGNNLINGAVYSAGIELKLIKYLILQGGIKSIENNLKYSCGLGIRLSTIQINWALQVNNDLPMTQFVTVSYFL